MATKNGKATGKGGAVETAYEDDHTVDLPCDAGEVGPDGRVHDHTFAAYMECYAEMLNNRLVSGWVRQVAAEARRRGPLTEEDAVAAGLDKVCVAPPPTARLKPAQARALRRRVEEYEAVIRAGSEKDPDGACDAEDSLLHYVRSLTGRVGTWEASAVVVDGTTWVVAPDPNGPVVFSGEDPPRGTEPPPRGELCLIRVPADAVRTA